MGVYLYPNNTETELKNAYIWIPNPTSIVLDKSSISLTTIWQTEQLTATIEPTISDHSITWSSDDTSVATVSTTGLVTCVTPWECTITATTVNGLTASCSVDDQQGWQPWANTLCYYPFDTDYSDQSWNGYNLTNRWATTIWTKWGVDCAVFIKDSNSWLYTTSVPFNTISTSMTFNFWMYVDQFNTGENNVFWIWNANAGGCIILWYLQPINIWHRWYNDIATSTTSTLSTWQNMVVTQDSSWTKIYLDWNQIGSSSYYATLSGNQFNVWYFNGSSALNRKYIWWMSNLILESKTWTAQEVADYYNQTKSLYGIS